MSDGYSEALGELYALAPRGIEPGLDRVRAVLDAAGRPERDLRVVHVAGTNGKGSVSAMIATGLAAAGQRVGLYTSPHLASLTERVRVLGAAPVEREDIARAWQQLRGALSAKAAPRVTFFEAVTAMAFALFRDRALDVVVLEVGLGGRLDATNVIERPLACAITRVGIDHQRFLGDDLASIAAEKAGILRAGVPAVIAPQREEAMAVIARVARDVGAPLRCVGRDLRVEARGDGLAIEHAGGTVQGLSPRLRGEHQHENVAVAAGVLLLLEERGIAADVCAAVETVEWPGRLERIERDGAYLLDAAHNADGCEALARFLAGEPRRRRVLLFGAMADKDWRSMIGILSSHVDELVFAAPALPRAERPEVMARAFGGHAAEHPEDAIALARELAGDDGEVIVAGSIYLMGIVRAHLLGLAADPPIAM